MSGQGWALSYASHGLPVLPLWWPFAGGCGCHRGPECPSPGKHPIAELAPHGKDDAAVDQTVITDWWSRYPLANIGVRPPVGLVVLDVDPRNGGHVQLAALERDHGRLPETLTARTGGGGLHIWLAYGGPVTRGKLCAGVDVKSATGYVVAPPSVHSSGGRYEWVELTPTAPAPSWVRSLLCPARQPRPTRARRFSSGQGLLGVVAQAPEGNRNAALYWAARTAMENGLDDLLDELRDVAVDIGLSVTEVDRTIRSAERAAVSA